MRMIATPAVREIAPEQPLWRRLDEAALAPGQVGGKIAQLSALRRAGFPVPDGVALTTAAFHRFIHAAHLGAELRLLAESLRPTAALPGEQTLIAARAKVRAARLGPELGAALEAACRLLPSALAVRSSATLEDLADSSFAGLYETQLNVIGREALEQAVKRCWSSLWQLRVIDYLRQRRLEQVPAMGVLLQVMVPADAAGVVFTVNPTTGADGEAVIEATLGLGEPLVSGRTEPDRYVVELWTGEVRSEHLGAKALQARPAEGGGLLDEQRDASGQRALDPARLDAVVRLAADVQEHLGYPVDAEFAVAGPVVHLLQVRPITRIQFAPGTGEWTTANFREGGVAASDCSPLMCSLYERAFEESMPRYLERLHLIRKGHRARWLKTFFGRPYWNFGEVKEIVQRTPGFVERNFDLDLGIPATYQGGGRSTPISAGSVARSLPTLAGLERAYGDALGRLRAFVAGFAARRARFDQPEEALRSLSRGAFASSLRALLDGLHQEAESLYFTSVYNLSNAKLELSLSISEAERRGEPVRYPKLVGGLRDVSHLRPLRALHRLAATLRAEARAPTDSEVKAFARAFRHKGPRELDLRVPRWSEDLDEVRRVIDAAVASHRPDADPDLVAELQHREYLAERARTEAALPWYSRWLFVRRLERVRALSWWREEMRDCSTFTYSLVRRWALEAGRRLVEDGALQSPAQAFDLSAEELMEALEWARAPEETRAIASRKGRATRGFRHFAAPNELGARYPYGGAPRWSAPRSGSSRGAALRGTASSSGVVEGVARVARTMADAHALKAGEILVAPFTDPGWVPALARCAAVVTESGGLLSHAAVIAREYGVAAVLAVSGATSILHTGQRLRVDGDAGTVEVLA